MDGPLFSARVTEAVAETHGRATLRPYQVAAIATLRSHRAAGRSRLLLACPTGGGKTLLASEIIRSGVSLGRRVMFVVHLRELVDQTVRALARVGVSDVGVMRGDDERVNADAVVQIASIQTLARRARPQADIIILDEAHRSLSDSYARNIWEAYPGALIIGLTATPCRGDGRPLGDRYEALVVAASYSQLIAGGFISEPVVYMPKTIPDMTGVRTIAGDWDDGEVERVMSSIAGDIVPTWQELAGGRSTIVFAAGIKHSQNIVARFLAAGVAAEHLDGTTPGDEREAILGRLKSGETTVVSNCAVLTEGFDMPSIRCGIIARPTQSLVLHMQTAGRVLRPGDVHPIIIDHANNVSRHGLPHEDRIWDIYGQAKRVADKSAYRTCQACFAYYAASAMRCPHCGAVAPVKPRELPQETKAVMVAVNAAQGGNLERAFYDDAVNLARSRGFKPGMAAFKFKEKYDRWPPWSWSQETKRLYAEDEDWQDRLERRVREKAFWAEADAKAKAESVAAEAGEPPVPKVAVDVFGEPEADENFGDWFEKQ